MNLRTLHEELGKILAKTDAGYGDYIVGTADRDAEPIDLFDVGLVSEVIVVDLYDEDADKFEPMVVLKHE